MNMGQHGSGSHGTTEMEQCIKNCQDCHHICIETMMHCLEMGGKHASLDHIRVLQDCIQICQTSADFMLSGSALHSRVCGVCAEACERCAQNCEQLSGSDTQMKACAEMCRRCSDSCQRMASAATT